MAFRRHGRQTSIGPRGVAAQFFSAIRSAQQPPPRRKAGRVSLRPTFGSSTVDIYLAYL